jgi:CheY-like chemotaxis protein
MPDGTNPDAEPPSAPQKLRILVVEDDPDTLVVTVELLRALGHWATGVRSAEVALHRFLEGAFDVLIADIGLPGLSGRDLAEKLQRRCDLPVIFATAQPAPARLPARGIWLRKPYSIDQLEEALAQAAQLGQTPP